MEQSTGGLYSGGFIFGGAYIWDFKEKTRTRYTVDLLNLEMSLLLGK